MRAGEDVCKLLQTSAASMRPTLCLMHCLLRAVSCACYERHPSAACGFISSELPSRLQGFAKVKEA